MKRINKIFLLFFIGAVVTSAIGAYLKILHYNYANAIILVSLLLYFGSIIGFLVFNFNKIKSFLS